MHSQDGRRSELPAEVCHDSARVRLLPQTLETTNPQDSVWRPLRNHHSSRHMLEHITSGTVCRMALKAHSAMQSFLAKVQTGYAHMPQHIIQSLSRFRCVPSCSWAALLRNVFAGFVDNGKFSHVRHQPILLALMASSILLSAKEVSERRAGMASA